MQTCMLNTRSAKKTPVKVSIHLQLTLSFRPLEEIFQVCVFIENTY